MALFVGKVGCVRSRGPPDNLPQISGNNSCLTLIPAFLSDILECMKTYNVMVGCEKISLQADTVSVVKDAVGNPGSYQFRLDGEEVASFPAHSLTGYWVVRGD